MEHPKTDDEQCDEPKSREPGDFAMDTQLPRLGYRGRSVHKEVTIGSLNPYASSASDSTRTVRKARRSNYAAQIGWCIVVFGVAAMIALVETPPVSQLFNLFGDYSVAIIFLPALYWEVFCRFSRRPSSVTQAAISSLLRCWLVYWIACLIAFFILSAITRTGPFGDIAETRAVSRMLVSSSIVVGSTVLAGYDLWMTKSRFRTEQSDARRVADGAFH